MAPYNDGKPKRVWTRRDVLKGGGLTLAGLGLGNGAIAQGLTRLNPAIGQALAATTGRKRALLVGINRYPAATLDWGKAQGSLGLQGCLTDVALMREVLLGRFGFEPGDILTLTDGDATRTAIKDAINQFLGPLTAQDTAVFQFSGCGTEWVLSQETDAGAELQVPQRRTRALVPVDGQLPIAPGDTLRDLPVAEVRRALAAVGSNRMITVMDASYGGWGGLLEPGVGRGRSRLAPCRGALGPLDQRQSFNALEQELLLKQLPQGLVLDAGLGGSTAVELPWGKVWAGALTYQLTQTLWHLSPARTLWIDLAPAFAQVNRTVGDREQPVALGRQPFDPVDRGTVGVFPLVPTPLVPGVTGQVVTVEKSTPTMTLGGLDPLILTYGTVGSIFEAVPSATVSGETASTEPPSPSLWQLRDHKGLKGRLTPLAADTSALLPGQRLQERGRLLPASLDLVVALDNTLERIERVDAISALTGISHVEIASESATPADLAFGRHREGPVEATGGDGETVTESASNRYGLFTVGGTVIPSTVIAGEEAVKMTVQRLDPLLKERLAEKWLRLTENQSQTAIALQVYLRPGTAGDRGSQPPMLVTTPAFGPPAVPGVSTPPAARSTMPPSRKTPYQLTVPTVPSGTALQYGLTNRGDQPLYPLIFVFDESGGAFGYVPSQTWAIAPGTTETLLQDPTWPLPSRQTRMTSYVVVGHQPWTRVQEQWELIRRQAGLSGMVALKNPVSMVRAVIADLGDSCPLTLATGDGSPDRSPLDLRRWATLKLSYRLV